MDVALRCSCGALAGGAADVDPERNRRIVCMCDDCQAYAHYLMAERVLDANGGTEIVPMFPAQLRITRGLANLACLRLSPNGLFRFYATCCRTPIANCKAAGVPYAGVFRDVLDVDAASLGRVFARMQGRFGHPPLPSGTSPGLSPRVMLYTLRFAAQGCLMQAWQPSPFFEPDGQPRVAPHVVAN
jgi:hypothetical protein